MFHEFINSYNLQTYKVWNLDDDEERLEQESNCFQQAEIKNLIAS